MTLDSWLGTQRLTGAKILVVSPTPTAPRNFGNRKRVHQVCSWLTEAGAEVDFVHYATEGDWRGSIPSGAFREMSQQWNTYHNVAPSIPLHASPRGEIHEIDEWWDPSLGNYLEWLFSNNDYDALLVNYTWLSKALEWAPPDTYKILDTHDRFGGRKELLASLGIEPEFFYTSPDQEAIAIQRADMAWAIKQEEAAYFRNLAPGTQIVTVPHAEHGAATTPEPTPTPGTLRVGLIGARNNINKASTEAFLSLAIPLFRRYTAPIQVVVAGSMCHDLQHIKHHDIEFLGELPSTGPFYDAVDLVVVPMTASTGLKIKVAEALSRHFPIVSHAHAFEGFDSTHPWHQLGSLEEIASACIDAAFDPELLTPLREASGATQNRLRSAVSAGLASTLSAVRGHRPSVLIEADATALQPNSLANARFEALSRFTSFAANVVIFIDFPLSEGHEATLSSLAGSHKVVLGPSAKSSAPQQPHSPDSTTRQQLVAAWGADQVLLTHPDLVPSWRDVLPVAHTIILDLATSRCPLPDDLLREEDILLLSSNARSPVHHGVTPSRAVRSRVLEKALPRAISDAWAASGTAGSEVHIFMPPGCKSLASYQSIFDAAIPSNRPRTYLYDAVMDEPDLRGAGRLLSTQDACEDLTRLGPRPRFYVQLPGDRSAASSALQDLYQLAAIPGVGPPPTTGSVATRSPVLTPRTLFDLHRALYRLATDDALIRSARQDALLRAEGHPEEGWPILWELLTKPNVDETPTGRTDGVDTDLFRKIS